MKHRDERRAISIFDPRSPVPVFGPVEINKVAVGRIPSLATI